jgi:DNA-binding response OmpR family regulator
VASVEAALSLLNDETPTVAVLDVNLADGPVTPVAEALRLRNVPFVVASAHSRPELVGGDVLAGAPNVGKPTDERRLLAALELSLSA